MKALGVFGRIIFAVPFILFGIFHFMNGPDMAQMVIKDWPVATILVYVSGFALILAGISIIFNIKARLASFLLALLLLIIIIGVHLPSLNAGNETDVMSNFLKDVALMGAAITYGTILGK